MKIVVAGGDGYIGWPLSLRLAKNYPEAEVIIIDNCLKRLLIKNQGTESVVPIISLKDRVFEANKEDSFKNLSFRTIDVTTSELAKFMANERPNIFYHLAQIPSAPYSMANVDGAVHTLINNEVGNTRLVWAVRKYCPECQIIKLGSFGEYCAEELDVAEGYFCPIYNGKQSTVPVPYPRRADDVYHITKINDSNILAMASSQWNLKVTEIMQATIFGVGTKETLSKESLHNRFDCDPNFGTVVNRFVAQAVLEKELTIYGTGNQRTGLMYLGDAIDSLASLVDLKCTFGEHKIINHLSEKDYCINEIADIVIDSAKEFGLNIVAKHGDNPRAENVLLKKAYDIESSYKKSVTPMKKAVAEMIKLAEQNKSRISPEFVRVGKTWF